jgi:hypothetical protein
MIKYCLLLIVAALAACKPATEVKPAGQHYAIQNIVTDKCLRPYEAGKADGNAIILYDHQNWKCMTWEFIKVEGETYRLKNLFTAKTFGPVPGPEKGAALKQQPLADGSPEWEFIKEGDTYLIKYKGTDLYITISSEDTNSAIVLMPKQDSAKQQWRLVAQEPTF